MSSEREIKQEGFTFADAAFARLGPVDSLMPPRLPVRFYFQVMLCAALWGSAFPVIKLSYAGLAIEGVGEQLLFAGSRFMLAGLFVVPFCRRNLLDTIRRVPKASFALVVLGQIYLQYVCFYFGLSVSSGVLGALLIGAGSMWWVLLAPLFLKTTFPSVKQWLVLSLCSVGIGISVYAPGAGSGNVSLGTAAFLLAALSGAVGALGVKRMAGGFGSRSVTALALLLGGVLLLATGSYSWRGFWGDYSWVTFGVTVYLAFVSATAFTLWNNLIERYSVNVLSAYRFLIPLCGVVESVVFVETESVGVGILLGGTIVIGSLMAMNKMERAG